MPWVLAEHRPNEPHGTLYVTGDGRLSARWADAVKFPGKPSRLDIEYWSYRLPQGHLLSPLRTDDDGMFSADGWAPMSFATHANIYQRLADGVVAVDRPSDPTEGCVYDIDGERMPTLPDNVESSASDFHFTVMNHADPHAVLSGADLNQWAPKNYQDVAAAIVGVVLTAASDDVGDWIDVIRNTYEMPPTLVDALARVSRKSRAELFRLALEYA